MYWPVSIKTSVIYVTRLLSLEVQHELLTKAERIMLLTRAVDRSFYNPINSNSISVGDCDKNANKIRHPGI